MINNTIDGNQYNICAGCNCRLPVMTLEEELVAIKECSETFSEDIEKEKELAEDKDHFVKKVILCDKCYDEFMINYRKYQS